MSSQLPATTGKNNLVVENLTEEQYSQLDNALAITRTQLMLDTRTAFIGALMYRIDYAWLNVGTACTNGINIYYDPNFFTANDAEARLFVLIHELWHVALRHVPRIQDRIPTIWNIACDYVVNSLIMEDGFKPGSLEGKLIYDTQYDGYSTEQIYDILIKQMKSRAQKTYQQLVSQKGNPGGTGNEDQQGQGQGEGESQQSDKEQQGDGESQDSSKGQGSSKSKNNPKPQELPESMKDEIRHALDLPKDAPIPNDLVPPQGGASANNELQQKIDQAIMSAYNASKKSIKGQGSMPGELEMFIDEFSAPTLPWFKILYKYFNSMTDEAYSLRRPNRFIDDPILKGRVGVEGLDKTYFYLDVSGSISDEEIVEFNSEVAGIKKQFNPEDISIITFDTSIRNVYRFLKSDSFKSIKVIGRGGTDLQDVFRHINENKPDVAVIFTDLWVDIPEDKPKSPLIWIVKGNDNAEVPYGKLIKFD